MPRKAIRPESEPVTRAARLPKQIDDWLANKIQSGEYPNYNQAIIGELKQAKKTEEERALIQELKAEAEADPLYNEVMRRINEIKIEVLDEFKKKKESS